MSIKYKGFAITKDEDGFYVVRDAHTNEYITCGLVSEKEAFKEVDIYLDELHNFNRGPFAN